MRTSSLLLIAMTSGCFAPEIAAGLECGPGGSCPPGQSCVSGLCGFGDDADGGDLELDAMVTGLDGSVACDAFEAVHFDACAIPTPGPALDLDIAGVYRLDSKAGTLTDPNNEQVPLVSTPLGGDETLVSIQSLIVRDDVQVQVRGSAPLIIASWSHVVVEGAIDASSSRLGLAGPGAGPGSVCSNAAGSGTDDTGGAGGGGGGGFGSMGGDGGLGDNDGIPTPGAEGGASASIPTTVRAGCSGGPGGDGQNNTGGAGGAGGGAVQLTAALAIAIDGSVFAGGAGGGAGASLDGAGGGGGSGGYIGLDAPAIDLRGAVLLAGGGGGGEGAAFNPGNPGQDALQTANPASGGFGGAVAGGRGGDGAVANDAGESSTELAAGGGGGGGGGVGFVIASHEPQTGSETIASPTVTVP